MLSIEIQQLEAEIQLLLAEKTNTVKTLQTHTTIRISSSDNA